MKRTSATRIVICLLFVLSAVFFVPRPVHSQATTQLVISPVSSTATTCADQTIAVRVQDVTDLYAYSLQLTFTPGSLQVLEVTNGGFLAPPGEPAFFEPTNGFNNTTGTISFGMTQMSPALPKSGSGDLILIRLRATTPGATVAFTISTGSALVNWPAVLSIPFTVTNGSVTTASCAPTDITLSNNTVAENLPAGTTVGTLSTVDPDPADTTFTYTFADSPTYPDNLSFQIDGSTLETNAIFDYETKNSYTIQIRSTDAHGASYTEVFTITVLSENDPPTVALSNTTTTLPENTDTTAALKVADITVSDDALGTNVLSLTGTDASFFEIVGTQLRLKAGSLLDFETNPVLNVTVNVDDSTVGITPDDSEALTITITDVNEPPTVALSNTTTTLPENTDTTTALKVSDITVSDDALGTNVLSLTGTDASLFEIVGTQLRIKAGSLLDFETNPVLNVTVNVDDSTLGITPDDSEALTITITNVNEPPTVALSNTTTTLPENTYTTTALKVANITVSDDALGTNVLSLSGADASLFEIVGAELRIKAGSMLDFETNPVLNVTVNVDDSTLGSTPDDSEALTITITNVNEPPTVALSNTTTTLPENTDTTTALKVADITVSDDALGTNVLSLSGTDASLFEIVGAELRIKAGSLLDFETNPVLNVTVNVDDSTVGSTPDDSEALAITITDVNEIPVLNPITTPIAGDEGTLITFTATGTDPDGQPLTFSLIGTVPTGATIDPVTGAFTWTPTEAQGPGAYTISVQVCDNATPTPACDTQDVVINVGETNVAPVLDPITTPIAGDEGTSITFDANASDADLPGQSLTFSLIGTVPTGATIDPVTGAFTWTPTEAQGPGSYTITVQVCDNAAPAACDTQDVVINVGETNVAPVLDPITSPIAGDEGTPITFDADASDADLPGQLLTFSLIGTVPTGATIDPVTGAFTWTPGENQGPGSYTITVQVCDDTTPTPACDTQDVVINVGETNVAPVLDPITTPVVGDEGTPITFDADASDADLPTQPLTFALIGTVPPGATIDPVTGAFIWTPTEAQGPGSYTITVQVCDDTTPTPACDTQDVVINVGETNVAPVLAPITTPVAGDEGTPITFDANASDADLPGQPLTFALIGTVPTGATIDPVTGAFTWTPTEAQGPGSYTITVQVCDNAAPAACDTQDVVINVGETNVAPVLDPITSPIAGDEGTPITFDADASDADLPGQLLTFSLIGTVPTGATIDPVTGAFTWTPGENQGPGSYTITVQVCDDTTPTPACDTDEITVTVAEVNVDPVLDPITTPVVGDEGTPITFDADASDADLPGQPLTFSLIGTVPTGATIDPMTGAFSWTPTEAQGPGSYTITVQVCDDTTPTPACDTQDVVINVGETNVAPVLDPIPTPIAGDEGTPIAFDANASDADLPGQTLTFSLIGTVPTGTTIDPVTGAFTWTPTEAQGPGSYTITVQVCDDTTPTPACDTQDVVINVGETNVAPVLDPIPTPIAGDEGTPITFDANASDADLPAQPLTFSLIGTVPPGATIYPNTGEFTWTPTEAQGPDSYTITVQVCDDTTPTPACDTQDVVINVGETNVAPVLDPIPTPIAGDEGTPITFDANASDADLPGQPLTFALIGTVPTGATIDPVTGAFTWTPTEAQGPGSYTITVQVCDDTTPTPACDTQDVIINVGETNVAPVLDLITSPVAGDEGTPITFDADASDADLPGQPLTFSLIGTVPTGATIDPVTGAFTWTPSEAQGPGSYTITVQVCDDTTPTPACDSQDVVINVGEVNIAPIANDQNPGTPVNTPLISFLTATDADLPVQPFTFTILTTPTNGTVSITDPATGAFTYTPATDYEGPDSFTFTVDDNNGGTDTGTINISVSNDAPTADGQSVTTAEDTPVSITLVAKDPNGSTLTWHVGSPAHGSLSGTAPNLTYTPAADYHGPDSFTFYVNDGTMDSNTATVSITVTSVPDAPIATNQSVTTPEDTLVNITLAASDGDGDPLTWFVGAPGHGTITGTAPNLSYTPDTNYNGPDSFTFYVNDGTSDSNTATVSITVTAVNDAPVLDPITTPIAGDEGTPIAFDASASDADLPAQPLTFALIGTVPTGATIDPVTGAFSWTPGEDQGPGSYTITVQVCDNSTPPVCDTQDVIINVGETNVAPVLDPITTPIAGDEGTPITFDANASDADLPGQPLTFSLIGTVPTGATIDPVTGAFTWTPGENQGPGSYTITVQVCDDTTPTPACTTQDVIINVGETNVAPVLDPITTPVAGDEGTPITFDANASDADLPAQPLTFALIGTVPPGATIDPVTGAFSWTPGEDQGPGSYTITVQVCDDTTPTPACDTQDVVINVGETNVAPVLDPITSPVAGDEGTPITFDANASDADLPGQPLTFALIGTVPPGATIDPVTGAFTWTPTEAQGPGSYTITVQVCDNAAPPVCDTQDVIINVGETNVAPVLDPITTPIAGDEGTPITFDANASDADLPGQPLTFALIGTVPPGATIDPVTGAFTWTPTEAQGPGSYTITVQVCDDTTPTPACDTQDVVINVGETNVAPVLDPIPTPIAGDEGTPITFDANASDADLPAQPLTFSLIGTVPPGATIYPTTGEFSWTPTEAQGPGSYTITVQVCDNSTPPVCDTQDVIINVGETNVAPVLDPITSPVAGDEGTPITFDADASDADLPAQTLTFALIGTVPPGAAIDPLTGEFTWTPTEAQGPGSYTITVQICDDTTPTPACTTQDVIINVGETNTDPVLDPIPTPIAGDEGTPIAFDANASDADLPAQPLTFALIGTVPPGATIDPTTSEFSWTPTEAQGPGSYTITVQVCDNAAPPACDTQDVIINVGEVNIAPVADDQNVSTSEETALGITLTATDADGNPLTWTVGTPAHGTLTGTAPSLTYTPNLNYTGPDSFTFSVNDGTVDSNTATVSITVTPINDAPAADDQTLSTPEDTALAITLTATDPDGNPLTWTVGTPAHGTLTGTAPNLTYTPDADYTGPDSFTFSVNDGTVDSNTATVSITVTPINDAPTVDDQTLSTPEDTALAVTLTATDPDGDPLTWTVSTPAHGTLTGTAPSLNYTPDADYTGPDSFTFTVNDGTGDSNVATVSITVTPVNDAPTADDQTLSTPEDTALVVTLTATDPDGDPLTWTVGTPAHGTLTGTAPSLTYAPAADYTGPDSFTFTVNDGTLDSNTATVSITVTPINDAPVAVDDAYSMDEDTTLTVALPGVLANDTDVDDTTLSVELVSDVTHGSLSLSADGSFIYTPTADYFGSDSFTYRANDGEAYSNVAVVTITINNLPDNVPPVAVDDAYDMDEDTVLTIPSLGVLSNDSDADGDELTAELLTDVTSGVLTLNPDGSFTYTPDPDFYGIVTYTYRAFDGTYYSDPATVTITVFDVSDMKYIYLPIVRTRMIHRIWLPITYR